MKTWFKTTKQYDKWLSKLDATTRVRIAARVDKARAAGHFGDHKGVGGAVSEMRLDFGPGFRLYYTVWEYRGQVLLLLLGGDKSGQQRDIKTAKAIVAEAKRKAEQEIDEALQKR